MRARLHPNSADRGLKKTAKEYIKPNHIKQAKKDRRTTTHP
jgi:hypothetical protein